MLMDRRPSGDVLMTVATLLRSGRMGNYHVPFWRAVERATPSLTLIIKTRAVGHPVQALRGNQKTEPMRKEAQAVS